MFVFDCPKYHVPEWYRRGLVTPLEIPYKSGTRKHYTLKDVRTIRKAIYPDSLKIKKKFVTFFNIKGGCSKTTTSAQLTYLFALMGFKVLGVDLDFQQDYTYDLGVDPLRDVKYSIYDILKKDVPAEDAIIKLNNNLHIIGANHIIDELDVELLHTTMREKLISRHLGHLRDSYDIIIFDTHPIKNTLNISTIFETDMVVIPTFTDIKGYRGLVRAINHMQRFCRDMGKSLNNITRIVPTKYNRIKKHQKNYRSDILRDFAELVVESTIRDSAIYEKAADLSISIFNTKKNLSDYDTKDQIDANKKIFYGLNAKDQACVELKSVAEELLEFMRESL